MNLGDSRMDCLRGCLGTLSVYTGSWNIVPGVQ